MHRLRSVSAMALLHVLACGGDSRAPRYENPDDPSEIDAGKATRDGGKEPLRPSDHDDDDDENDGSAPMPSRPDASGPKGPTIDPIRIDGCQNNGELSSDDVKTLRAGAGADSARIVYPYDKTVFPRGTEGPLLMWDGVDPASAVYLKIHSSAFDYEGCLKPTGVNQLQVPANVWESAGDQTGGKADPFMVELTVLVGGKARGPLRQSWTIAKASFKGSVYYNSYSSLLPGAPGGKVFRIPPKGKAEGYLVTECNGCHSLSADGSRMVSQTLAMGGRSYDVSSGSPRSLPAPTNTGFAAMYPDGSRYLVGNGSVVVGRMAIASPVDVVTPAGLYETDSGRKLASEGLPTGALMPSFSPDGSLLVFNDAMRGAAALAVASFDDKTNRFGSPRELVRSDGGMRPGWPFLLPDNGGVVYVKTDGIDFSGNGAGVGIPGLTQIIAPYSELFMADVKSGKSTIMARAMGYESADAAAQGKSYLPFPDDTKKSYFPTISPVAAGGYVWVFFDSLRHYGNMGMQRQLWGTAIELSPKGDYSVDRSAPAFYLPGQEFGTGNHRAFTALDPCKEVGQSCESGTDCCEGICNVFEERGICGMPGDRCKQTEERCEDDSDCCNPEESCIAGFCSTVIFQ
jgi:hypothetical protein